MIYDLNNLMPIQKEVMTIFPMKFLTFLVENNHVKTSYDSTMKSRRSFLLPPAHPGGPGKRAVKQLWCGGSTSAMLPCANQGEVWS